MGRSRSRSGCRRIPPSVYCRGGSKRRRKRRGGSCKRSKRRRYQNSSIFSTLKFLYTSLFGRSRKRSRCGRRKKSCRGGKKTNNPFLNYLRVFRKKHCGWPQCKIAIEGAKCWCKMNVKERRKFYQQACSMRSKRGKKRRGRSRGRCGRRRSRRRRSRRRSSCGRKKRKRRKSRKHKCPM